MFTGIIEEVGHVEQVEPAGELTRLRIHAPSIFQGIGLGDSVAINGACLTVAARDADSVAFDAVRETLECTAIGDLAPASAVNLERAMPAGGRLDGHIVQGHVDGVGTVRALDRSGDDVRLMIDCDAALASLLVDKGSVTIDGVSLTVVTAEAHGFDVALIPHTLQVTTLSGLVPGSRVNLEADILGKYVKTYLDRHLQHASASGAS